jgi:c-di-GMP-binding flagellar brake protein YcgR
MKVEKIRFLGTLINIGDNLNITIKTDKFKGVYKTNVENVDDNYIYVDAPFMKGEPVLIPHGAEVECTFVNKYGKFVIKTKVTNKKNEIRRILTINIPKYMYLIQMRNFFRVELREKIDIKTIAVLNKDNNITLRFEQKRGLIVDLSAGGARIELEGSFKTNQVIELALNNVITDISPVIGAVVKVYEGKGGVSYGIHFLSIKEKDRDKIVKFGLREQSKAGKLH